MADSHQFESTDPAPIRLGTSNEDRDGLVGWGIALVGTFLVALVIVHWTQTDVDTFDATVTALPGLATAGAWFVVRRSHVPVDLYPRVLAWTLGGGTVLGGLILVVLLVQGGSLVAGIPLLLFMAGVGTMAGILSGANRAQSLWARRQAEALRAERERLSFLNHLLRHNVLNKINVIQGNATIAAEESNSLEEHLNTIVAQSDDVVELIESVRVLVTATTAETAPGPVDLSAALAREVEALGQAHDVEVVANIPEDVEVIADDLLRYVFENLLANAVEHNDAHLPRVAVGVDRDDDAVRVTVADNGPGVPEPQREHLFEPVMQGDHGIGLYLVATLVARYGGTVSLADDVSRSAVDWPWDDDTPGAVFTVELQAA